MNFTLPEELIKVIIGHGMASLGAIMMIASLLYVLISFVNMKEGDETPRWKTSLCMVPIGFIMLMIGLHVIGVKVLV